MSLYKIILLIVLIIALIGIFIIDPEIGLVIAFAILLIVLTAKYIGVL